MKSSPQERPTNVRWGVFGLMAATSWLLYLHRYVFSFLKPIMAKEWELSDTELGQIDSIFAIAYGGFQFPLAIVADAFGVHLLLSCLLIVWLVGLGIMCRATTVQGLKIGLLALGAGQSAVYACLNRVGRMWYPSAVRTTMQGIVGILAGRLGNFSASLIFSSLLLGVFGLSWPTAVLWFIAAGAVHLVLFAVFFRNSPREHPWVNDAEARLIEGTDSTDAALASSHTPMSVRRMARGMSPRSVRNLLFLIVQSLLSTIADNLFSNWIPLFLSKVHELDYTLIGIYASLPLLGGAIAGLVGGALNDYLIARTGNRRWVRAGVAFVGKSLAAAFLLVALLFYEQPLLFCLCLFCAKFFGDWSLSALWGVVSDIGGRATASVFAIINAIATIGQFVAPLMISSISQNYGWPRVFVVISATLALCALSWVGIDCTIPVVKEDAPLSEPRG